MDIGGGQRAIIKTDVVHVAIIGLPKTVVGAPKFQFLSRRPGPGRPVGAGGILDAINIQSDLGAVGLVENQSDVMPIPVGNGRAAGEEVLGRSRTGLNLDLS